MNPSENEKLKMLKYVGESKDIIMGNTVCRCQKLSTMILIFLPEVMNQKCWKKKKLIKNTNDKTQNPNSVFVKTSSRIGNLDSQSNI